MFKHVQYLGKTALYLQKMPIEFLYFTVEMCHFASKPKAVSRSQTSKITVEQIRRLFGDN